MKSILFCHDTYYSQSQDNTVLAYGAFPYSLWEERFLPHFDRITVLGRRKAFDPEDKNKLDISSGTNVQHILLDNINTPLKRLTQGGRIYQLIEAEVAKVDAVIIRGPVEFGMLAAKAARKLGKPYAVEMSGCAFDHTWFHGSLIGKLYAPIKYLRARQMVSNADQAIYVTEHFLQKRYPNTRKTEFASNVELEKPNKTVLTKRLKHIQSQDGVMTLGLIGNYGNDLKGLSVAFKALKTLHSQGQKANLRILGKGNPKQWQPTLEEFGLTDVVHFDGTRPGGKPVLDWLDSLDIYIQPSMHEGLPRAVIEAMSRALPVCASNAGGTEEMLDAAFIHKKKDNQTLSLQLSALLKDKKLQAQQAEQNFKTAHNYTKDVLKPKRHAFWTEFASTLKK